ncbi:hypothetical protein ACTFIY_000133 [Dictyostelium cf. discoideum]
MLSSKIFSLYSKTKLLKSTTSNYILFNKLKYSSGSSNQDFENRFFKMSSDNKTTTTTTTSTSTPLTTLNDRSTIKTTPITDNNNNNNNNENFKYTNKLINEKSPYLLKHAHNPVDWLPWGEEAFKIARDNDKLIFLSVGYMACHWCNVMERECFENVEIAKVMNEYCVNIKIDREERPDIDKIYMTYLTEISGSGGWPMSIWLTPQLYPITGGTYFAPEAKYGRPGFPDLIKKLDKLWRKDREMVQERANSFIKFLKEEKPMGNINNALSSQTIEKCFQQIMKGYDPIDGGYSDAPKFPRCSIFNLLLMTLKEDYSKQVGSLDKLVFTLEKMANGGMYDQVGGGFHRYSVTSDWMIPHFEKMLYDNAQLASVYLDAYQITKSPLFERVVKEILHYVSSKLTHTHGGFFSAEDADSLNLELNEKQEGAFYVWSYQDIKKAIQDKDDIEIYSFHHGLIENGNVDPKDDPHNEFKDKNVITIVKGLKETAAYFKKTQEEIEKSLNQSKEKLFKFREQFKPKPQLDDKIIVSWNGLMVSSFCKAYQLFKDEKYLNSAIKSIEFIKTHLYDSVGDDNDYNDENDQLNNCRLIRNYKDGPSKIHAFTDDYSFLIQALLDLYQVTFDYKHLEWAMKLQKQQDNLFYDLENGGYYSTSGLDKSILSRMKEEHDGAEPSPQSISVSNLLKLYAITYNEAYKEKAKKTLENCSLYLEKAPLVFPQMVCSLYLYLNSINTIILSTNSNDDQQKQQLLSILDEIHSNYIPNKLILLNDHSNNSIKQFFEKNTSNLNLSLSTPVYDKTTFSLCNPNGCTISTNQLQQIKSNLINQIYPKY